MSSLKKDFVNYAMILGFDLDIDKRYGIPVIIFNIALIFLALFFSNNIIHFKYSLYIFCILIGSFFAYTNFCMTQDSLSARFLKKTFGNHRALLIHRTIFNELYFLFGFSITSITQIAPNPFNIPNILFLKIFGIVLMLIGIVSKKYALDVIGFGPYYYQEIFDLNTKVNFSNSGIYKYFKNPMYGLGYLHGYGVCFYLNSKTAFIIMLCSHILVYVFYFRVERPYIKSILKQK